MTEGAKIKVFKIPIISREIGFRNPGDRFKFMDVDGIGCGVFYKDETELEMSFLRSCLVGESQEWMLIEASSFEEAIDQFLTEWEGAMVGTKHKAFRLDNSRLAMGMPVCGLLNKSTRGEYICGPEAGENGNGEYGMCMIPGHYDPPDGCVVHQFQNAVYEFLHGEKQCRECGHDLPDPVKVQIEFKSESGFRLIRPLEA